MTQPTPPSRCVCGKFSLPTEAAARGQVTYLLVFHGLYRDYYRCTEPEGGWHLRDVKKRLAKIRHLGEAARIERDELEARIRQLDRLARQSQPLSRKAHAAQLPLEDQLKRLPLPKRKPAGRHRRRRGKTPSLLTEDETVTRGTRKTAEANELRRRTERARLREELRKEKDGT